MLTRYSIMAREACRILLALGILMSLSDRAEAGGQCCVTCGGATICGCSVSACDTDCSAGNCGSPKPPLLAMTWNIPAAEEYIAFGGLPLSPLRLGASASQDSKLALHLEFSDYSNDLLYFRGCSNVSQGPHGE